MRKARGYFRGGETGKIQKHTGFDKDKLKKDLSELKKKNTKCRACGHYGHWHLDDECSVKGKPKSHVAHAVWDDTDSTDAQHLASMKENTRFPEPEYHPANEFDFTGFVVNVVNDVSTEQVSGHRAGD